MKKENGTTRNQGKLNNRHFEIKESYLHKHSKNVLMEWINQDNKLIGSEVVKVLSEEKFCMNGRILFSPDLTIYNKDGVYCFIESVHTSPISELKLSLMQYFMNEHKWSCFAIEISSDWIMRQIKIPKQLKIDRIIFF